MTHQKQSPGLARVAVLPPVSLRAVVTEPVTKATATRHHSNTQPTEPKPHETSRIHVFPWFSFGNAQKGNTDILLENGNNRRTFDKLCLFGVEQRKGWLGSVTAELGLPLGLG